ncbi:hypothetical protein A3709_08685 [Halioglobus sp. HI00S01]|uniref:hypothetical protein n=1 Tax=Halioglobus sp. HI00S01 TaxID=1822214 RepID=UPI0007C344E4|nr:hypothetical protein [Halioglobus sp. HI00S01]KZX55061.1 hypothetical protein A3709_08685 [Halioglobus sp. HI00S01]
MMSLRQRYSVAQEPLRSERRAELVLLVSAAVLLLLLIWGGYRAVSPALAAPIPPSSDSLLVTPVSDAGEPTLEQRKEIQARPLFWESRAPLEPVAIEVVEEAPVVAQAKPLKGVTLKGVFGAGEDAGIIVLAKGKKRRLMVGDDVNGWTLDSVEPTQVRLVDGAREAVLELKRGKLVAQVTESAGNGGNKKNAASKAGTPPSEGGRQRAASGGSAARSSLGLGGGDRDRQGDKK